MDRSKQELENFWLDLGPAADWADMDAEAVAERDGDASPDGRLRGYSGAENGTVYRPSDKADPDAPGHGQQPDINTGNVPVEMPPIPPETWPGL